MTSSKASWPLRTADLLTSLKQSVILGPGLVTGFAIIGGMIATFAGQMLISRHLGVGPYGQYALLVGWSMLLVLPASLGIDGSIMRFMPGYLIRGHTHRLRWLIAICVSLQLIAVLLITGALQLLSQLGIQALGWVDRNSLVLAGSLIGATVIGNTAIAVLQSANRVAIAQLFSQLFRPLLVLVGAGGLIYGIGGGFGPLDLFAVTAFAAAAVTLLLTAYVTKHVFAEPLQGPRSLETRSWLSFAAGNLAGGIGQQALIQVPLLLVGNLSTDIEAGHYGIASRLAAIVLLGLSALTTVSMPLFAAAFDENDRRRIQRMATFNARMAFAFALSSALGFALLGTLILKLFGPGFVEAYPVLLVLVAGLLISSAMGSAVALVAMSGRPSVVAASNGIGVILICAVAWFLVPKYGALGGAAAYVAGSLAALLGSALYARLRLGVNSTIFGGSRVYDNDGIGAVTAVTPRQGE